MVAFVVEYKCVLCGAEIDETEYGDHRDADICGWCFATRFDQVMSAGPWPKASNACGRRREAAAITTAEICLEVARKEGNQMAVQAYERMLRVLRA